MENAIAAAKLVVVLTLVLKTLGTNQEYEWALLFPFDRLGAMAG